MGKAENDRLRASGRGAPFKSFQAMGGEEQRRDPRYLVSWRVALSVGDSNSHYGRVRDISLHGAAILSDLNIKPDTRLMLSILIPTLSRDCEPKIMAIHGKAVYTAYDAEQLRFRVGVSFIKFEQADDRAYLEERLVSHHLLVPDSLCRRSTD